MKNPFVPIFVVLIVDFLVAHSMGSLVPEVFAAVAAVLMYFEYQSWKDLVKLARAGTATKLFFVESPSPLLLFGLFLTAVPTLWVLFDTWGIFAP